MHTPLTRNSISLSGIERTPEWWDEFEAAERHRAQFKWGYSAEHDELMDAYVAANYPRSPMHRKAHHTAGEAP